MSQGPVSVRFLNSWITSALAGESADIAIRFEETILVWNDERNSLEVRLVNISFQDQSGMPLSSFPEAGIEFSGAALFRGMLAPSRLEVFGPKLAMGRMRDGTISFGGAPIEAGDVAPEQGAAIILLGELLSDPEQGARLAYLQEVTISAAELSFMDRPSNTFWDIPDAQLSLVRSDDGIHASLFGEVEVKGQLWTISASGDYAKASGVVHITLDISDIEPYLLASDAEALSALKYVHFPISGTLEADVTRDGKVLAVAADLIGGAGYVDLPQYYPNGFEISSVELKAAYRPEDQTITIVTGAVSIEETVVDVEGFVAIDEDGVETNVKGTLSQVPAAELSRYWPLGMAVKTRSWIRENITAGTITEGEYWVHIKSGREKGPLTSEEIEVKFEFEDLTGHYTRPMPPLVRSDGNALYAGDLLDLYLDESTVNGLLLSEGHLTIDEISGTRPMGTVDAVMTGTLKDTLDLIDSEPLNSLKRANFTSAGITGTAATRTHLEFPLGSGVTADEILYAAAATVTDAYLPEITDKIWLDRGDLLVQVNSNGLVAEGSAEVNGVLADVEWNLHFEEVEGLRATYDLSGVMNVESLKTLDIDVTSYLEGDVSFDASISQMVDGMMHVAVDGDITAATASIPLPGWGKDEGAPGSLHVDVDWREGEDFTLRNMHISSEDFEVAGDIRFSSDVVIQEADFPVLRHGSSELAGKIENVGGTDFRAELIGPTYDAGPLLEELLLGEEGVETGSADPYKAEVRVKFDSVLLGEGVEVTDFAGAGKIVNDFWTDTRFDGKLNGSALFAVAIEEVDVNERLLRVETHDASTLLRGLGYFDGGEGGILNFTMNMHEAGDLSRNEGKLIIDDFRIRDMPALGRILSLGSLTGFSEVMAGEGISFERLYAPFAYNKEMFGVREAKAFGPALGFTLSGGIDRTQQTLHFDGTIVPAYSINSVLGSIPIVGLLFVGEEGSGVFAISYDVQGTFEDPVFSVNPLSALTPGFLRGITSVLDPVVETRVETPDSDEPEAASEEQAGLQDRITEEEPRAQQ